MRGLVPESRLELPSAAADMNLLLIFINKKPPIL
jgi:hypothetical protein